MEKNKIICTCNQVTYGEIEDAVLNHGCDSVEKVQEKTEAGTVCGGCIEDIEEIIKKLKG
ncbi:MAG: (2Fe-2S)-binding protein [Bacteroidales bacterium]|jgi:NAD(P)H-nitrite reductase large subunit|nr:(2Fe-2S)-binding protein [Bacteroidales bacterium]HOY39817.1 (2Fe-2S)-binding protein [Bacteroidales bacterium]HQP05112.1 (2Fe-2S)-binding protein [Bacteroidales bacterium]